jgi:hypothetical protein
VSAKNRRGQNGLSWLPRCWVARENARAIADENNLTLMTWYGIEPVVFNEGMLKLLDGNSKLQQFAVRRLAYEIGHKPASRGVGIGGSSQPKPRVEIPKQKSAAAGLLASFPSGDLQVAQK